jgi:FlaA1/EpsC-like NDP-sugar epimerase
VLVVVRLAAFLVFGVYRGIWRYTSMDDLMTFRQAVAAGSIVSMTIVFFVSSRVSRAQSLPSTPW